MVSRDIKLNGSYKMICEEDTSPPWRGEMSELNTLNDWGGLMISEQNDEECDARDDDQGTEAGKQKIIF